MILALFRTISDFNETGKVRGKLAIASFLDNQQLTYMSIIGDLSCSEFERDIVGFEPIDDVLGRTLSESDFLFTASVELS